MSGPAPIVIAVHYDFASTLCYVAHRVLLRIAPALEELALDLQWTPLDLAGLMNWKRGHPVSAERRANAARVSRELAVPVTSPRYWIDSRAAMAVALCIESAEVAATWRERVFSEIFESENVPESADRCIHIANEVGIDVSEQSLAKGFDELQARTIAASSAEVAGVPTLMLGGFPIGGIQSDETMLSMLGRYARNTRERMASGEVLH